MLFQNEEIALEHIALLERLRQKERQDHLKGSVHGSVQATDRLMKELRDIYRSDSYKKGMDRKFFYGPGGRPMHGPKNWGPAHRERAKLAWAFRLEASHSGGPGPDPGRWKRFWTRARPGPMELISIPARPGGRGSGLEPGPIRFGPVRLNQFQARPGFNIQYLDPGQARSVQGCTGWWKILGGLVLENGPRASARAGLYLKEFYLGIFFFNDRV